MKKFLGAAVFAAVTALVALTGCATSSSASASSDSSQGSLAGRTYRQEMSYYDGSSVVYTIKFNDSKTYDFTLSSQGAVMEKYTYKYTYNEAKKTMTVQMASQWLPDDLSDLLAASTPQDYAKLQRVPNSKSEVVAKYASLVEDLAAYYAAVGAPLTKADQQDAVNIYKSIADYNFDAKTVYDAEITEDSLVMVMQFAGLSASHMQFYTPHGTNNDSVTSIYFSTGNLFELTFDGVPYSANITSGTAPVVNTSKKTITAYLTYSDENTGAIYEFGDLVCSYTTKGSGKDTVLVLTVKQAPAGLKEVEGTVAELEFIPDGFHMTRAN